MMEHSNKRGWIKNVIIIFLVIMLLLTLFSNTIMNRSLPEVSVSNASGGQITSQVKLSGTVSANRARQILLEEARTVDAVLVRRGDVVQRGDILATLVAGESTEVYDLQIELQRLEIEYKQMMMTENDSLVGYYRTIEDAKKALAKLDAYTADYTVLAAAVKACEEEVAVLEADLENAEDALKELESAKKALVKEQSNYSSGGYTTKKAYEKALKAQKDAVADADDATSAAKKTRSDRLKSRTLAQKALDDFDEAYENKASLQSDLAAVNRALGGRDADDLADLRKELADKRAEYEALLQTPSPDPDPEGGEEQMEALSAESDALAREIEELEDEIEELEAQLERKAELEEALAAIGDLSSRATLEMNLENAKSAYTAADNAYEAAVRAEEEARDRLSEMQEEGFEYFLLQERIEEYEEKIETAAEDKDEVAERLADAEERLAEAKSEVGKTPEECEEERVTHTRAIEDAEAAIERAKTNGAIEDETAKLNLSIKKSEIDRKRKQIADLRAELTETEITAPVSGTVASVSVAAGDETAAGAVLFEITMDEMGYTMECSVTNSQAARLRVGQEAEVQYYYWGEKPSVRISQIVGDPNSGGKNKLVTFQVEGDVTDGTSLSLAIGTQGASYDTILPNSAIREDANGQFILRVTAKSSPLGNRYYAERLDVEVLASDATRSAINASLSWGDYVITGASVPISAGMQVRMAEQ